MKNLQVQKKAADVLYLESAVTNVGGSECGAIFSLRDVYISVSDAELPKAPRREASPNESASECSRTVGTGPKIPHDVDASTSFWSPDD